VGLPFLRLIFPNMVKKDEIIKKYFDSEQKLYQIAQQFN
jgi:hypothetical protein